jgi:hypothetical protein
MLNDSSPLLRKGARREAGAFGVSRFAFRVSRFAFGVWRLAFGVWRLAFRVWRLAFGVSRFAFRVWRLARIGRRGIEQKIPKNRETKILTDEEPL